MVMNARRVWAVELAHGPVAERARAVPLLGPDGAERGEQGGGALAERGPHRSGMLQHRSSRVPEGVRLVVDAEVGVQVATAFAPRQRRPARDAVHHLGDAALVHAVLGPRAGEVLHAADLDRRHTAGHAAHTVAVGVPGGVGDDAPAGGATTSRARRWRRGAGRSSRPIGRALVAARRSTAGGGPSRAPADRRRRQWSSSQSSCSVEIVPVVLGRDDRVEQRDGHARQLDPLVAGVLGAGRGRRRGCRARRAGGRRTRRGSTPRTRPTPRAAVLGEVALHDDRGRVDGRRSRATAARFIMSGYGGSPGSGALDGPGGAVVDPRRTRPRRSARR